MLRLPEKQEKVWRMISEGLSQKDISEILGITKQAVSQYCRQAREKLATIFITIAKILDLDIHKLSTERGILIGRCRQIDKRVFVFYIPGSGPIALFEDALNTKLDIGTSSLIYLIDYFKQKCKCNSIRRVLEYAIAYAEKS